MPDSQSLVTAFRSGSECYPLRQVFLNTSSQTIVPDVFLCPNGKGATASISPDGSKVLIHKDDWYIWLSDLNEEGSNLQKVSYDENLNDDILYNYEPHLAWHPNGNQFAYTSYRYSYTDISVTSQAILSGRVDDVTQVELVPYSATEKRILGWSSDGEKLIYMATQDISNGPNIYDIYLMDMANGSTNLLISSPVNDLATDIFSP